MPYKVAKNENDDELINWPSVSRVYSINKLLKKLNDRLTDCLIDRFVIIELIFRRLESYNMYKNNYYCLPFVASQSFVNIYDVAGISH